VGPGGGQGASVGLRRLGRGRLRRHLGARGGGDRLLHREAADRGGAGAVPAEAAGDGGAGGRRLLMKVVIPIRLFGLFP